MLRLLATALMPRFDEKVMAIVEKHNGQCKTVAITLTSSSAFSRPERNVGSKTSS